MMASDGMLSLSWNNHKTTFCHILSTLREKERYTDVTLACEGKFYPVHKLVLSTCSEYFEKMFDNTPCKHPVVVLKDIKCSDIEALLSYMYAGVVSVLQQDLARLIKAAELLQIKGLAVPDEPPVKETPKKNSYSWSSRDDRSSPHPKRRRREENSTTHHPIVQPVESPPSSPPHQEVNKSWEQNKSIDQRADDSSDQRQNDQTDHSVEFNATKQEVALSEDQAEETLVKEEVVDSGEENPVQVLEGRLEYGGLAGSEGGGEEPGGKFTSHLDPKHPQPLHEAVVEALAGPSGMQGWLGTGELGGGFGMLEGYSEDGGQDVHGTGQQQAHQMVQDYSSEATLPLRPVPNIDVGGTEQVTYKVFVGASKRGQSLLIDSKGYRYNKKSAYKRGNKKPGKKRQYSSRTIWTCSVRQKGHCCLAKAYESGGHFTPGPQPHIHPA